MRIKKISQYIEGGAGLPSYFTDEIDTGMKWIDGKPIYRKVFTGNIPTTGDVGVNLGLTFDQLVSENMYIKLDSGLFLKQGFHNSSGTNIISYGINGTNMNSNIYFSIINSTVANKPYVLILEYTKTTD